MNHYPISPRRVPPRSCEDPTGTADPFASITCPKCRERLAVKVEAHLEESKQHPTGSQERTFFAADAMHYEQILNA